MNNEIKNETNWKKLFVQFDICSKHFWFSLITRKSANIKQTTLLAIMLLILWIWKKSQANEIIVKFSANIYPRMLILFSCYYLIILSKIRTFQCLFISILGSFLILLTRCLAINGISLDIAPISATFNCEADWVVRESPSA